MHHPSVLRFFACVLSISLVAGCTTTQNIHGFRGKGKSVTYDAAFVDVWEDAKEAGSMIGLGIKEENMNSRYIIFGKRISLMSYGELVGVYFEPLAENKTRVEVISKPKVRTNVFAPNWEDDYLGTLTPLVNTRTR